MSKIKKQVNNKLVQLIINNNHYQETNLPMKYKIRECPNNKIIHPRNFYLHILLNNHNNN